MQEGLIGVVYAFARSGGTLVNQLLGVHPDCLVLSEVNPAACYKSLTDQAIEWLGVIDESERTTFERLNYIQAMRLLHERAAAQGKRLIVRDWVTVNFLPGSAGDGVTPSRQLEQEVYLSQAEISRRSIVVARRASAVYESITRNFEHLVNLNLEAFAQSYLCYAESVNRFPVVHLEDLQARPKEVLEQLLEQLDLNGDASDIMIKDFPRFKKCTGNITLKNASESAGARKILVCSAPEERSVGRIHHPLLLAADKILGYD